MGGHMWLHVVTCGHMCGYMSSMSEEKLKVEMFKCFL